MPRIIVFYDISNDKTRAKIAKLLEAMGFTRIQRSVYTGRGGITKAREVIRAARRLINTETDSLAAVIVPESRNYPLLVTGTLLNTPRKREEPILIV